MNRESIIIEKLPEERKYTLEIEILETEAEGSEVDEFLKDVIMDSVPTSLSSTWKQSNKIAPNRTNWEARVVNALTYLQRNQGPKNSISILSNFLATYNNGMGNYCKQRNIPTLISSVAA